MAARTTAIALSALFGLAGCDRGPEPAPVEEPTASAQATSSHPAQGPNPHAAPANPHAGAAGNPHAGLSGNPHAGLPGNPHAGAASGGGSIDGPPAAGGLTWEAPVPLQREPVQGRFRSAQYTVAETDEDDGAAELKVYFFGPSQGGSVQANVERWKGQFQPPEGKSLADVTEVEEREVDGVPVTYVDVRGTFRPMQMPGQGPAAAKKSQRMLAAIADGPGGRVFFKLVGDEPAVTRAEKAFDEMLGSLRPAE